MEYDNLSGADHFQSPKWFSYGKKRRDYDFFFQVSPHSLTLQMLQTFKNRNDNVSYLSPSHPAAKPVYLISLPLFSLLAGWKNGDMWLLWGMERADRNVSSPAWPFPRNILFHRHLGTSWVSLWSPRISVSYQALTTAERLEHQTPPNCIWVLLHFPWAGFGITREGRDWKRDLKWFQQ